MTEYKLGDYVRIHDHDGAEITVRIDDSGIPNRQGGFTFKAGARIFKNSEILGLGEVPVVNANRKFEVGDQVVTYAGRRAVVVDTAPMSYQIQYVSDRRVWASVFELTKLSNDTEVHADLVAENEAVKHPAHYGGADDPYEAIKVIEAWDLNFNLGSVLKYVRRAGKKDASKELEDLRKARFYIDHEITRTEQKK